MEGFKAGSVYIEVEPDTRGFAAKVRAALAKLRDAEVGFDAVLDTAGVHAEIARLTSGKHHIDFETRIDRKGYFEARRQKQEMQRELAAVPIKFEYEHPGKLFRNDAAFFKNMTSQAQRAAHAQKQLLDAQRSSLGDLKSKYEQAAHAIDTLTEAQIKSVAQQAHVLDELKARRDELGGNIEAGQARLADLERGTSAYERQAATVRRMQEQYAKLGEEIGDANKKMDEYRSSYVKAVREQQGVLDDLTGQMNDTRKALRDTANGMDGFARKVDAGYRTLNYGMVHAYDNSRKWRPELERQSKAQDRYARSLATVSTGVDELVAKNGRLNRSWDKQFNLVKNTTNAVNKHKKAQRELTRQFAQYDAQIKKVRSSLAGLSSTDTRKSIKTLDDFQKRIDTLRRQSGNPVRLRKLLDLSGFEGEYESMMGDMLDQLDRLSRENDVTVRVRWMEENADDVEMMLRRLKSQRVNIPVDLDMDLDALQARMRRAAELTRLDPETDYRVEMNLDLDLAEAKRKVRDFQNDNDKLDMDVDLETALARAHLAYFTRPRTVDIFARFRGTDVGKILAGMTVGATGLKGVENSFRNLVNLFDTLDKKVPKLAFVGAVLSDIGAGATNLAGTIGGVGKSLVSLSKAAYAAPAALTGFGLAYASMKMIIGDKAKAWSENINLAGTALENLGEKLQQAFYERATPAFKEFANTVGDVVGPQMQRLAALEADVFNGVLKMVNESNKIGQLGRVFTHVNDSIRVMVPGVHSLVQAFLDLSDAGGQYLTQFANWVSRNITWFSAWARSVQADGAVIDRAMGQVKEQAGYLADSFFALKNVVKGVFTPLAQNQNGLERFAANLEKAERAVNSISFQDTMNAWVTGAQRAQHGMRDAFRQIGVAANEMRSDVSVVMANMGELTGNVVGDLVGLLARVSPGVRSFSDGVKTGFSSMTGALKDAAPMFRQLIDMVGSMTKAFGGTFAATLRAAAPSITALAKAAQSVAETFNRLPESVKGALGLWVTFGKAGVGAFDSLKMGMLENIQNTLQYQKTLRQLGLSADKASVGFGTLVQAQARMRSGNVAGILSENARSMDGLASAAKSASPSVLAVGENLVKSSSKLSGVVTTLKNAGGSLLGAVGGIPGLVVTAGLTAAMTAFSSYQQHVSQAQSVQEGFNEAARATPGALSDTVNSLDELPGRLDNFAVKVRESFNMKRDFWDNLNPTRTDFGSAAEALQTIGRNVDDVSRATTAGRDEFEKYGKALGDIIEEKTRKYYETSGDVAEGYKKEADAAQLTLDKMNDYRQAALNSLKIKAKEVGMSKDYVDALDRQGHSLSAIADGLLTADEKAERFASANTKLTSILGRQQSSMIKSIAAGSSYYALWNDQIPTALQNVSALLESGQRSWNAQTKSFELTSEAGRAASDMLLSLASNSNEYIESMIANGESTDAVTGKYNELAKNFGEAARQAGVADEDVQGLTQSLLGTPENIKVRVEMETLQAKTELIGLIDTIQFLFPDGSREQTRSMLVRMALAGDLDPAQLQRVLTELSDENHTIQVTADGKNVYATLDGVESYLRHVSEERWQAYVQAKIEGKDDVEALALALEGVPNAKETLLKAKEEGKSMLQAFVDLLTKLPEYKKVDVDADTGKAHEKMSAFIDDDSVRKTIPADLSLDDAEHKARVFSATAIRKPVEAEIRQPSLLGVIASIGATFASAMKPITIFIRGNNDDAKVKLQQVAAYDGATVATSFAKVLGDNAQARTALQQAAAYDGVTVSRPWLRVMGEDIQARSKLMQMTAYNGRTIARPWLRVMGENTSARLKLLQMIAYNGRTIARPWVVVDANSWPAKVAIMAMALTDGRVIATNYVDIVTRRKDDGGHAATGGRITGIGTGTSDSIPMWLSNGEHVIKAASVDKLDRTVGPNFLNVLNATGSVSKALANANRRYLSSASNMARGAYATGGRVSKMSRDTTVVETNQKTVNQTFNLQTKIVRSQQDLYAAAQIQQSALLRNAGRQARG